MISVIIVFLLLTAMFFLLRDSEKSPNTPTKLTSPPKTGTPGEMVIGKVTCKLCGEIFGRADWIANKGKCLNPECIVNNKDQQLASRAEKRRIKNERRAQEMQERNENKRQERLENTVIKFKCVENETENTAFKFNDQLKEKQVFFECANVIERHIMYSRMEI